MRKSRSGKSAQTSMTASQVLYVESAAAWMAMKRRRFTCLCTCTSSVRMWDRRMVHGVPVLLGMHLDAVKAQLSDGPPTLLDREIAREPVEGFAASLQGMRVGFRRLEPGI